MALSSHITCNHCDAVFKLQHDMDNDYYKLEVCPFCSEALDEDNTYEEKPQEV